MITSVRIESLRGIRTGVVEGLGPLSVLIGPNNSGKSTVLDALLIGAHPVPAEAIGPVVQRRGTVEGGARWLFWRSGKVASVAVTTTTGTWRRCALERQQMSAIRCTVTGPNASYGEDTIVFDDSNAVTAGRSQPLGQLDDVPAVDLVQPHRGFGQEPLHRIYTRVLEGGRLEEVDALLAQLLPGFKRIEILADKDKPVVYISYKDGSVPAGLQGDGVQSALRLALDLAAAPGGVVLLEEPEPAQHPRALHESARAVVAAVKRGVQVILSTHSLDFLDMLRTHLGDDLAKLSVHRLACVAGELSVVRYSGAEVALARDAIGDDLR